MNGKNIIIHSTLEEGYDFFITDQWNKRYHFKIATFKVPSGYLSEAIEVIDDHEDYEPRIFHVLSDFYADTESQESQLKDKIRTGINRRYLDYRDNAFSISDELEVAGRILSEVKLTNSGKSGFDCFFVIDGRKITIETFVEMLHEYVGWNFRFKIYDTTEDIDQSF
jgi:hypothetical protein